jgi:hypothetical protein
MPAFVRQLPDYGAGSSSLPWSVAQGPRHDTNWQRFVAASASVASVSFPLKIAQRFNAGVLPSTDKT